MYRRIISTASSTMTAKASAVCIAGSAGKLESGKNVSYSQLIQLFSEIHSVTNGRVVSVTAAGIQAVVVARSTVIRGVGKEGVGRSHGEDFVGRVWAGTPAGVFDQRSGGWPVIASGRRACVWWWRRHTPRPPSRREGEPNERSESGGVRRMGRTPHLALHTSSVTK
jgi:hypothetical protein